MLNVGEGAWNGAWDGAWGASADEIVFKGVFGLLHVRVLGEEHGQVLVGMLWQLHGRLLMGVIWRLHGRMLGRVLGRAPDWKDVRESTTHLFSGSVSPCHS